MPVLGTTFFILAVLDALRDRDAQHRLPLANDRRARRRRREGSIRHRTGVLWRRHLEPDHRLRRREHRADGAALAARAVATAHLRSVRHIRKLLSFGGYVTGIGVMAAFLASSTTS